jgi:hypothetical protein
MLACVWVLLLRNSMNQKKRSFTVLQTCIFSAVLILFSLCFVEFVSYALVTIYPQFFYKYLLEKPVQQPFHPFLGWKTRANFAMALSAPCEPLTGQTVGSPEIPQTVINTNQDGLAIVPVQYKNPDITIVITGGSTMFGHGQDNNTHSVSTLLANMIYAKLGVKAQVINLAQCAYRSFQEMNILNEWYASGHKADIVLSISGTNDAAFGFEEPEDVNALVAEESWHATESVQRMERSIPDNTKYWHWLGVQVDNKALAKKSYFFQVAYSVMAYIKSIKASNAVALRGHSDAIPYGNIDKRVGIAIDQYTAMAAQTRQHGGTYIMMLQPIFFSKNHFSNQELYCANTALSAYYQVDPNIGAYIKRYYDVFRHEKKSFTYVDLSDALDKSQENMYVDWMHYTVPGATVLANAVFEEIKPRVLQKVHGRY